MAKRKIDPVEARIEKSYYRACSGVPINIMDISKVFAEGRRIVATGVDDAGLDSQLRAFVDTIA